MIPGEIFYAEDDIVLYPGECFVRLSVLNTGDRPVQVGSHYHFFEVNRALRFDRAAAWGLHLAIPAGTAARFEPGEEKEIELVAYGGARYLAGFNVLADGPVSEEQRRSDALASLGDRGFQNGSV